MSGRMAPSASVRRRESFDLLTPGGATQGTRVKRAMGLQEELSAARDRSRAARQNVRRGDLAAARDKCRARKRRRPEEPVVLDDDVCEAKVRRPPEREELVRSPPRAPPRKVYVSVFRDAEEGWREDSDARDARRKATEEAACEAREAREARDARRRELSTTSEQLRGRAGRMKARAKADVPGTPVSATPPWKRTGDALRKQRAKVKNRYATDDVRREFRTPAPRKGNGIPAGTFYGAGRPAGRAKDVENAVDAVEKEVVEKVVVEKVVLEEKAVESVETPPVSRLSLSKRRAGGLSLGRPGKPAREPDERLRPLSEEERGLVRSATYGVAADFVVSEIKQANIVLHGCDIVRLRGRRWLNDEVMNAFAALVNCRNAAHFRDAPPPDPRAHDHTLVVDLDEDDCTIVEPACVRPGRPRAYVFNSFFFTRLASQGYDYDGVRRWTTRAKVDVRTLDLVLVPVNLDNFHWVLAAIDLRHREFLYFDSMYGGDTHSVVPLLSRWLFDEVANKHGKPAAEQLRLSTWSRVDNPPYLPRQSDDGSCGVFSLFMADYLELGKTPDFSQDDIPLMRQRTVLFLKNAALPES